MLALITQPGFSTASSVTQLAGRGVGMDVVANEIKQLGGALSIESKEGQGTTFVLRLPFTLAVTQAILVRLGEAIYAIPMSSVQGVVRIGREDLDRRLNTVNPIYTYAGEEFHIYELAPQLKPVDTSLFGSGTLGLHAKNFSVDDRSGFIGHTVVLIGATESQTSIDEMYRLGCAAVKYGASRLVLTIPYFGYSTMERATKPGEVVTAKTVARVATPRPWNAGNTDQPIS